MGGETLHASCVLCLLHFQRQYRKRIRSYTPANSAGEATQKMLVEKRISNKINYDVLKDLMESYTVQEERPSSQGEETVTGEHGVSLPKTTALEGHTQSGDASQMGPTGEEGLCITRHQSPGGRLPSLMHRKRPLPVVKTSHKSEREAK